MKDLKHFTFTPSPWYNEWIFLETERRNSSRQNSHLEPKGQVNNSSFPHFLFVSDKHCEKTQCGRHREFHDQNELKMSSVGGFRSMYSCMEETANSVRKKSEV